MEATIALAGNPNCGKTTLFNALTGARQHVGNYPGITVDKKEGTYIGDSGRIHVVDLPGTYSLTAYSLEEVVARDYLVREKPGVVVNIVDASNLERNLYLTLQFLEMGVPVCIALNMMDVAEKRGFKIDSDKLSRLLGVPVIPTIARSGQGKDELMAAAAKTIRDNRNQPPLTISYGEDVDNALLDMEKVIRNNRFLTDRYNARWIALKYLEKDEKIMEEGREANAGVAAKLANEAVQVAVHLKRTLETYPEAIIADYRYGYINTIVRQDVIRRGQENDRLYMSDKIDSILTQRFAGPLIMLLILLGVYQFTFSYSEIPVGWCESLFAWLGGLADAHLPDGMLKSLIISGVIDGVGGVLGFVPLILFMFFAIAFLEDTGYLARVAFMLDRIFRIFGLHGSSVMPFIVSGGIAGGCAVPGVMAARTLKSPREQLATLLTVPFMNCGAKLPVFALLVGVFFAENEALMMFIITIISWIGALLVAKLLRSTVIRGEATPFVMELPPYRFPTFRGLIIHTWERTWQYIKKAGTVILGISVLLWAMMTFPGLPENRARQFEVKRQTILASAPASVVRAVETAGEAAELPAAVQAVKDQLAAVDGKEAEAGLRYSAAGRLGTMLEGVSQWAGFDWRTNIALVGGFAAKEVVISTLGTAYSLGEVDPEESGSLGAMLANAPGWGPLTALSLMIFTMFYAPCFVTVVCIVREAGSWKWGLFSMAFNTIFAFTLSVMVYQIGSMLGF
ncbi:ferrous iron transporter B [Desulfonema ishimotonii]|uniref:Ferrous iron transport protein B n=1 Tax=Desulfonema ishimotonii TaxID=45657 RepID=A0A401FRY8_9BACT|nr:ferrous iron transport protein B [Desulfonema ishimotonii]GBC59731.1 ferrous iron transporter B [Desulfonema ishimotonii]